MHDSTQEQPTRVRWWVISLVTAIAALLYLDRFCISFAQIYIQQDLSLSHEQMGYMFGAFFATYALAQVPAGWLTDRYGARRMFGVYVLAWSLFTALTGAASGFAALLALRLGLGVAQAGAFPTSAAILSRWVPLASRGMVSSLVAAGGRTGGALAPLATALLIVAFVPTSQDSTFTKDDIRAPEYGRALHVAAIASSSAEPPLRAWVFERHAPSIQQWARSLQVSDQETTGESSAPAIREASDTRLRDTITADLNRMLSDVTLPPSSGIHRSALPREAVRLMERGAESLEPAELQRLNRLLLETAFPDALGRIYVHGWRPVMWTFGLLGVPLAVLLWWTFRDSPREHPWVNQAERQWIEQGKPPQPAGPRTAVRIPIVKLMTNRSMWLNSIMQFTTNIGWVFLVTWLPEYLEKRHRVPVEERALMTSIPVVVGFIGMLWGGRITDVMRRRLGLRWGRAVPMGASRLVAILAYLLCLFDPSPWMAVACLSLVAFGTDLGVGATWAYCQDVGGRNVGAVLGWGNMWGNFGAAIAPPLMVWIVGTSENWEAAFAACAAAFLISALAGLGIDARDVLDDDARAVAEPQAAN